MPGDHGEQRGQALLMVTLAIVVIFGLLGLVVDVGWMHYRQLAAQTAADSAAAAAAQSALAFSGSTFTCGANHVGCQSNTACPNPLVSSPANSIDVACAYANSNGFAVKTGGRQTVSVAAGAGTSPPTAPGVTVAYWVTVRVSETVPQLFSAILGDTIGTVAARATAGVSSSGGAASCLYTLDPSMKAALSISNGVTVNATCGIFVNSNNSDALDISGGATVNSSVIRVVGGYSITGGARSTPTPTSGATATADPFASLPNPSYSGCDHTGFTTGGGSTYTISPGVYCNGMNLSGGSKVTFQPGTYVINGGGVTMGGGAVVNGTGITIFNTASTGHTYAPFNIANGATVTFTAPASGTYRGVLMYNDRNISSSSMNTFSGGTVLQFTGSLYFPTTPVTYSGGSNTTVTALLAKNIIFNGGAYFAYDSTGAKTGLGTSSSSVIE